MRITGTASIAILLFAFGCGGAQPKTETPAGNETSSAEAVAPAAPDTWRDDLSQEQKAAFMKAHVVPRLGKVFQEADPTRYAEFGCKTCHGPNYQDPKEYLPKLTFSGGQIQQCADKAAVCQLMGEKVMPEMAAVLGEPPFNPETHEGFGCGGCHAIEVK